MRPTAIVFVIAALLTLPCSGQSELGSLCVAPIRDAPALGEGDPEKSCALDKLSLKIDTQLAIPWSRKTSVRIQNLSLSERHRIVVMCGGKPQQSFSFRFSEFKSKELCLFMNEFYGTVQLWESVPKQTPWCKCK